MPGAAKKPSVAQTKKKQSIQLALRIERAAQLAKPCSFCRSLSRTCFLDLSISKRCSECVRSKRCDCNTPGYVKRFTPERPVCRFRIGKTVTPARPPTPPPELVEDDPIPWFPAFEPDAYLASFFEGPVPDLGSPSFWANLDFVDGSPEEAQGSGG